MEKPDETQKGTATPQTDEMQESIEVGAEVVPLHIPPENHPITLEMIDPDALFILQTLSKAGFSGYLVGGGVRDLYLGKKPKDFDISTNARPGQLRKLFPRSNTIGRRFRLVQVFFGGGKAIEVSTLRSLSEHDLDGPVAVLAPNNTFGTLSEDARRRDLTINSLFYEIEKQTIIDYVRGFDDLQNGIIRVVGDPERRFTHDPVRMMRAIRHAARNNFTIEEKTWQAILKNADKITLCPTSRLRDELLKDIYSGASAPWFTRTWQAGIYTALLPIYRKPLHNNSKAQELLHRIFQTIDRVNSQCICNGVHRQQDFFLLGLILIPWAEHSYQLYSVPRKGAQLFKFGRIIREELDNTIGQSLNLRRSLRQEAANLLVNLAQLIHTRNNKTEAAEPPDETDLTCWPKWLKRKSYFEKTLLFYQFYLEADTGKIMVPEQKCIEQEKRSKQQEQKPKPQECSMPEESGDAQEKTGQNGSRGRGRVAFAPQTEGGVFGFRKK